MKCEARALLPSLKQQLKQHQVRADKRFGQHFLLDGNITNKITHLAGKLEDVNAIEIGPGPGGLTRSLLNSKAKAVYAVEKDSRLLPLLEELKEHFSAPLHLIEADALKLDLITEIPAPRAIIANLPYNVGTAMLIKWLNDIAIDSSAYQSLTLMFQKEVVSRIAAAPASKHYGRLSVISQWLCEVKPLFDLPPNAFTPPPKVESSVVKLVPRENPIPCDLAQLERITAAAFGQRRKMLRSSLKSLHATPEALLESCNIAPTERAERLTLQNFVDLANKL